MTGDTMISKPAEENERNLSPPRLGTFKTTATEMSILQSTFPLTILIKIKLNTHIIRYISGLTEHNIKIKQTRFQYSLNSETFRLTRSRRLFSLFGVQYTTVTAGLGSRLGCARYTFACHCKFTGTSTCHINLGN
jgi:hypothetical protein